MRSNFEERIKNHLESAGVTYGYETEVLYWEPPFRRRKYIPDFIITKLDGSKIYIEAKGRLTREDRVKLQCIKEQYPNIDLRLVFEKENNKLYKGSKTTYRQWAEKQHIPCCQGYVDEGWLFGEDS